MVEITLHSFFKWFSLNFSLNFKIFVFEPKTCFLGHDEKEMETFIQESKHADENSERHEVEMLTPLLDKNKITTFQSMNAFIIS